MNEVNAAGKRFRSDCRFGLHIDISKADDRGVVLEAVAHKYRSGFADITKALAAQDEFRRVAELVRTDEQKTPFALYGVTYITDERDGTVNCVFPVV